MPSLAQRDGGQCQHMELLAQVERLQACLESLWIVGVQVEAIRDGLWRGSTTFDAAAPMRDHGHQVVDADDSVNAGSGRDIARTTVSPTRNHKDEIVDSDNSIIIAVGIARNHIGLIR